MSQEQRNCECVYPWNVLSYIKRVYCMHVVKSQYLCREKPESFSQIVITHTWKVYNPPLQFSYSAAAAAGPENSSFFKRQIYSNKKCSFTFGKKKYCTVEKLKGPSWYMPGNFNSSKRKRGDKEFHLKHLLWMPVIKKISTGFESGWKVKRRTLEKSNGHSLIFMPGNSMPPNGC